MIDVKRTGENIKNLCGERNITPTMLMKRLGFASTTAIYKWFNGQSLPSIDNCFIIAEILDVSVLDLIVYEKMEK